MRSFSRLLCTCIHMKTWWCGHWVGVEELPFLSAPVPLPSAPLPATSHCQLSRTNPMLANNVPVPSLHHDPSWLGSFNYTFPFKLTIALEWSPGFEKPIFIHSWHFRKVSQKISQTSWPEVPARQWKKGWPEFSRSTSIKPKPHHAFCERSPALNSLEVLKQQEALLQAKVEKVRTASCLVWQTAPSLHLLYEPKPLCNIE